MAVFAPTASVAEGGALRLQRRCEFNSASSQ